MISILASGDEVFGDSSHLPRYRNWYWHLLKLGKLKAAGVMLTTIPSNLLTGQIWALTP